MAGPDINKTTKVVQKVAARDAALLAGRTGSADVSATVSKGSRFLDGAQSAALGVGSVVAVTDLLGDHAVGAVGLVSKRAAGVLRKPLDFLKKPLNSVINVEGFNRLDTVFDDVGKAVANVGDRAGITPWFAKRNSVKGDRAFAKATELVTGSRNAPSELEHHFSQIESQIAHAARGNPLNKEAISASNETLQGLVKDNKLLKKAAKQQLKAAEKAIKKATAGAAFHEAAAGYRNMGTTVSQALKDMPKAPIGTTVMNAGFLAGATLATFGVASGVIQNYKSLRMMIADEKGTSPQNVGIATVMFGKHSAPVMAARKHFFELAGVQSTAEILGLALTIVQTVKGHNMSHGTMFKLMIPQMVAGGASQMLGESALPYYSGLRKAYNSGKEIPQQAIAEFIGIASPELKQRGGAENAFTQEIAKQFAAEHLSPGQIMKEIPGITKRVEGLIVAQKEARLAMAPAVANESKVSFADRVNGTKKMPGEVVGAHTGKLQETVGEHTTGLSV